MPKENESRIEAMSEDEKQKLLEMSEISILVKDYEYIFSDFDPKPFNHRSISDDFLNAARKSSYMKAEENLELKFMVPKSKRSEKDEELIKKRLHEHFKKHFAELHLEITQIRKKGIIITILGFALMLAAAYIATVQGDSFFHNLIITIFEPAGWFTTWFGLDQLFYNAASKKEEYKFYSKMAKCKISFYGY